MNQRQVQTRIDALQHLEDQYINEQFEKAKKLWIESEYKKRRELNNPPMMSGGFSNPLETLLTVAIEAIYAGSAVATKATAPTREQLNEEFDINIKIKEDIRKKYKSSFNLFINDLNDDEKDELIGSPSSFNQNLANYFYRRSNIQLCDTLIRSYKQETQSNDVKENIVAVGKIKEAAEKLPKVSATKDHMAAFNDVKNTQAKVLEKNNRPHEVKMFFALGGLLTVSGLLPFVFPLVTLAVTLAVVANAMVSDNSVYKMTGKSVDKMTRKVPGVNRFFTDNLASDLFSQSAPTENSSQSVELTDLPDKKPRNKK